MLAPVLACRVISVTAQATVSSLNSSVGQLRVFFPQFFLVEGVGDGKHRIELEHLARDAAFFHIDEDVGITD
jgi:hypothetical protein